MDEIINRLKKVRRGAMFIIEAPSGTGKSAVVKEILKRDSNIKFSVSVTTRKPRENEVDGVDYYYVTNEQYDEFLAQDAFYEHVESQYGDRYGTLRSEVDSFINIGQDVMFDMDWAGARQMREKPVRTSFRFICCRRPSKNCAAGWKSAVRILRKSSTNVWASLWTR